MRHHPLALALLLTVACMPQAHAAVSIPLASLDLAPMTQEYGQPEVDRSVGGRPLRIAGQEFPHGLGTHAASQLTIRVERHALRFHARVGVDDEGPGGTVEFHVRGDGKPLWSSGIMRAGQPAKEVDVPLAGVALVVLETDATADGNTDDHADWAEAELIMEDGAKPTTVADPDAERDAGAGERTPSHAQYFTWINNTNEGATEAHTLTNLAFFRWLRDTYGMQLDIYAWDAGNLDLPRGYGTTDSARFRAQYPHGWQPIADAAGALGCRLGLWGGPDGFGDTPEQAAARIALMSGLCRDYRMAEFKFDGVCGQLRPEKQDYFVQMMQACRKYSPDLVLLNHRLPLGKGLRYATTFLFEGAETYIDVHMANTGTATHHRAGALARGLPPRLTRLTEDHGVCISSCLEAWDDDLVLQAFNRSLILAPEIYGNPWLLRDDEYPKLARIYNLHRRWRDLLTQGMVLPEAEYGPHAVARGDATTRVVTLRNLGWEPRTYQVALDEAIGLSAPGAVTVRLFHPHERILGTRAHGERVPVTVAPFSV
ncbi:MAG: NPCBM/NEW2 domain-containing protein, partial [Planctomycetes bacterium]|nr:NPCBM/NEW2 domain-containing protein [Planctomycetota bacterium]